MLKQLSIGGCTACNDLSCSTTLEQPISTQDACTAVDYHIRVHHMPKIRERHAIGQCFTSSGGVVLQESADAWLSLASPAGDR